MKIFLQKKEAFIAALSFVLRAIDRKKAGRQTDISELGLCTSESARLNGLA
jgi:hypothetical protein